MSLNLIRFCRHSVRCGCRRKPHLDMRLGSGRGGVAQFIRNARFHAAPKIALYVFADLPHQCNCGRLSRKNSFCCQVCQVVTQCSTTLFCARHWDSAPKTYMWQRCTLRRKFVLFSRPEFRSPPFQICSSPKYRSDRGRKHASERGLKYVPHAAPPCVRLCVCLARLISSSSYFLAF